MNDVLKKLRRTIKQKLDAVNVNSPAVTTDCFCNVQYIYCKV